MLIRKENLADFTLSNPKNKPVDIVKPLLEKPGNIANPCAIAIIIELLRLTSLSPL
jgi:hypothetical protein